MPDLKDIIKEVFDVTASETSLVPLFVGPLAKREETKEEISTEAETPSGLLEVLKEVFGDDTKE